MAFPQAQLTDLHDIVLPEPVPWTPQTAGWLVLAALLVLLGAGLAALAAKRYRSRRYRREALASLADIERALTGPTDRASGLSQLPVLVKRTALAFADRESVASLNGDGWLRYLDATLGGADFADGPGRALPVLAYGTPEAIDGLGSHEIHALTGLIRRWIRKHRVRV